MAILLNLLLTLAKYCNYKPKPNHSRPMSASQNTDSTSHKSYVNTMLFSSKRMGKKAAQCDM